MALFSSKVSDDKKAKIASKLLEVRPAILISKPSALFNALEISTNFLELPVTSWADVDSFKDAINVVHGVAERTVKLGYDFLHAARSEEHFQNTIHVVEANRALKPNLRN